MKLVFIVVVTVSLAGCASQAEVEAKHDGLCRSFGYTVGTPDYANCRLKLHQQTAADNAAMQRALVGGRWTHPAALPTRAASA
jgi:hypothetical protein